MRIEFLSYGLGDVGSARTLETKEAFSALLVRIERLVPAGRERAIVLTKLQEACMWATRGIAMDQPSCNRDNAKPMPPGE